MCDTSAAPAWKHEFPEKKSLCDPCFCNNPNAPTPDIRWKPNGANTHNFALPPGHKRQATVLLHMKVSQQWGSIQIIHLTIVGVFGVYYYYYYYYYAVPAHLAHLQAFDWPFLWCVPLETVFAVFPAWKVSLRTLSRNGDPGEKGPSADLETAFPWSSVQISGLMASRHCQDLPELS